MDKIFHKGEPLTVIWNFRKPDGSIFDISGLRLRLFYTCANRQGEVPAFATNGNSLQWVFTADKQIHSGDYSLRLVIYQYNQLLCVLHYMNAFTLANSGVTEGVISRQTEEGHMLVLTSVAEFYKFAPVIPIVGANGNWFINGEDTGISVAFNIEGYATTEELDEVKDSVRALGEAVDDKIPKGEDSYNGNIPVFDPQGNLQDSGKKPSDFLTEHQDISHLASRAELQSALASVVGIQFKEATAPLPTPSAQTGGKIYLLPITGTSNHTMWVTVEDNGSYAWLQLGTSSIDVSGKADKVPGAVNNNFASLDGNGNLKDSGKKPSDFITQHQDISGKADKSEMSVEDGTGANADKTTIKLKSGTQATVLKQHQDISGKMEKVPGATSGNFAAFDANGNVVDSGKKPSDFGQGSVDLTNYYTKSETETRLAEQAALLMAQINNGSSVPDQYIDSDNAVIFIDHDGTILYTYSASDFAALESLPAYPAHNGLRSDGWNWSLANAQAYVAAYGRLTIGMQYTTDDNKTRLYINLADQDYLSPTLYFHQDITEGVLIDWGDGSNAERVSGVGDVQKSHTYATTGNYVITLYTAANNWLTIGNKQTLDVPNSMCGILGSYAWDTPPAVASYEDHIYLDSLRKVELGYHVKIRNGAFYGCRNLRTVTVPNNFVEFYNEVINANSANPSVAYECNNVFHGCSSLKALVFNSDMAYLSSQLFYLCGSLEFVSLPYGMTGVGVSEFNGCSSLRRVELPDGITAVSQEMFCACVALESVRVPATVTAIGYAAFFTCSMLHNMNSLPAALTSIAEQAFENCAFLRYIHLLAETPPTLADVDAFDGMPSNFRIYVPAVSGTWNLHQYTHMAYAKYAAALNWNSVRSNGHLYEEGTDYTSTSGQIP